MRILGPHHRPHHLALHARRRHLSARRRNTISALTTALFGQPGLFKPHKVNPWFLPPGAKDATSYYDNTPLRETLEELVDFKRLNDGDVHFSVGAVNVLTGNFIFFDNRKEEIRLEHVMASGALPPGLSHGADRHRLFLGRRHRLQHAAAASAGAGRRRQFAWCSRWICSAPAASCPAPCRTCWAGTRTSCIPRAPAR